MNTINAFSSGSTSSSWMVARLFGGTASKQNTSIGSLMATLEQSKTSAKTATTSSSLVASELAGAFPDAPASTDPGGPTDLLTAREDNEIEAMSNAESSEELSDGLYGAGVVVGGTVGAKVNFSDILQEEQNTITGLQDAAQDPNTSASDQALELSESQKMTAFMNSEATAYAGHTMVFQKASDVTGLDYQGGGMVMVGTNGDDSAPSAGYANPESYNVDFLNNNPDGKTHPLMDVGNGVMMYLTW